jgi:hypothetical protein
MKFKPLYIKYKSYKDQTGTLIPFYSNGSFPNFFKIKRFFFLFGIKKYYRADHAHKKCNQIIIPIKGSIKVTTYFNNKKKIFLINPKKKRMLFVPTYTWIKIKFYKTNDCLLTLCSYKYNKQEYINNFSEFKEKYF